MEEVAQVEPVRRKPGPKGTGKASRISPESWETFLADLEAQKAAGIRPSVTHAAELAGHTRQTMYTARRKPQYAEFASRWHTITGDIPMPGRAPHPAGDGRTVIAKGTAIAPVGATVEERLAGKGLLEIKHGLAKEVFHAGLGTKLANIVRNADELTKEGKADVLGVARFVEVPMFPKEVASEATVHHKKENVLDGMSDEQIAEKLSRILPMVQKIVADKAAAKAIPVESREVPSG